MKTTREGTHFRTDLSRADREGLGRIVTLFRPYVKVEPIGQYRTVTPDQTWLLLVGQVCVMGSARHMERLHSNPTVNTAFEEAVSLQMIGRQQDQVSYLAGILRQYSATRFPTKSAQSLVTVLESPRTFRGRDLILFEGLSHKDDTLQTREELIRRCPIFRLKSASDFMISVGLSHDVIALDTRVVGTLQKYFDYNLTSAQIQSHQGLYLSLEGTLRDFCHEQNVSLALLDRLLFRFSSLGAIELVVKYPRLLKQL